MKAKKMKLEIRKVSNNACRKDLEAEEKWLEHCGEDEELLKCESKRLHRDILRIAPAYIGGPGFEGEKLFHGCTVVVKPSELTPLTALAAAELALQSGIPPGAVNVVLGNAPEIGDALLASRLVRKITFTGSTAVGKKLMAGAAQTVKKVSLELGGNAPCIIFDDADLEVAVKGPLATKFRNSGQTCVCANRILVQEGIYEKFANAFSKAVQSMQVGEGFTEGVVQGPLINEAAVQKAESFVKDAVSKGAKVLLGGKRCCRNDLLRAHSNW